MPRIATPPSPPGSNAVRVRERMLASGRVPPRGVPPADDFVGETIIGVVAQEPFDLGLDTFAHIIPCWFADGSSARNALPGNGLVWWKLGGKARDYAKPGKLVEAKLEVAGSAGEPDKAHYQVTGASAVPLRSGTGWEVLRVPPGRTAKTVFDPPVDLRLNRQPSQEILLQCDDVLVGPVAVRTSRRAGEWTVRPIQPADGVVAAVPLDGLTTLSQRCEVSTTTSSPDVASRYGDAVVVSPNFLLAHHFDAATRKRTARRISVESDRDVVERVKQLIPEAGEWEEFAQFLHRVTGVAAGDDSLPGHVLPTLERLRTVADRHAEAVGEWLQLLQMSEMIEKKVEEEVTRRADGLVEDVKDRAAKAVDAAWVEADGKIKEAERLADQGVEHARQALPAAVRALEEAQVARDRALGDAAAAKVEADRVRAEADVHTAALAERLESGRSELIREAAALAPLLGGIAPASARPDAEGASPAVRPPRPTGPALTSPADVVMPLKLHLSAWAGHAVKAVQVRSFLAAVLSHPIIAVPGPEWGRGLAAALGAAFTPVCVEPGWLSFRSWAESEAGAVWRRAAARPEELHVLHLDGPNRGPSTAWVCPLASLAAGLRDSLPLPGLPAESTGWPPNLRVLFAAADGPEVFEFPGPLLKSAVACGDIGGVATDSTFEPKAPTPGHVTAAAWRGWADPGPASAGPPSPARRQHLVRLLAELDPDAEEARDRPEDADQLRHRCKDVATQMTGEWLRRLCGDVRDGEPRRAA